ncbi:MAG: PEP-CTERM sorting domain-containing protein [Planctomycetia bacterium]|nr:PEP-CTERM sorting domain-containing protein [Planctomycetia bacterium]
MKNFTQIFVFLCFLCFLLTFSEKCHSAELDDTVSPILLHSGGVYAETKTEKYSDDVIVFPANPPIGTKEGLTLTGSFSTTGTVSHVPRSDFATHFYIGQTGEEGSRTLEWGNFVGSGYNSVTYFRGNTTLTTNNFSFGDATSGKHTVHIQDKSSLNVTGTLTVGNSGELNLSGGKAEVANLWVKTGVMNISDGAELTITGEKFALAATSGNSYGIVNQTGGSVTVNANMVYLGEYSSNTQSEYNISGGSLTVTGSQVRLGKDGKGKMTVSGGNVVFQNGLQFSANSELVLSGGTFVVGNRVSKTAGSTIKISFDGGTVGTYQNSTWGSGLMDNSSTVEFVSGKTTIFNTEGTDSENNATGYTISFRPGATGAGNIKKTGLGMLEIKNVSFLPTGNLIIEKGTVKLNRETSSQNAPFNGGTIEIGKDGTLETAYIDSLGWQSGSPEGMTIQGTLDITAAHLAVHMPVSIKGGTVKGNAFRLGGTLTSEGSSTITAPVYFQQVNGYDGGEFKVESGVLTISSAISNWNTATAAPSYTKTGKGTLVLSGDASLSFTAAVGETKRTAGTQMGDVTINPSAIYNFLGGSIVGAVANNGTFGIEIGNSSIKGSYTQAEDAIFDLAIQKIETGNYHWGTVNIEEGTVNLAGLLELDLSGDWNNDDVGKSFQFLLSTNEILGTFENENIRSNLPDGLEWIFETGINEGKYYGAVTLTGNTAQDTAVPEPATWCLMLLSLVGMIWYRRRTDK